VLLIRNKDREYNNRLASFATRLCRQRIEHERTAQLRWAFRGPRGHDFAQMGLTFINRALPTWLVVHVQKSDFHLIKVLCDCLVIVARNVLCLAQVVFSYFVLHSSKIPFVHTTKVTHLRSLQFRQPDVVNCVVRRVYLTIIAKLSQKQISAVSGLWINLYVHVDLCLNLLTFIGDLW